MKMTELKTLAPGMVYDFRYATVHNFMHRQMYRPATQKTYMRQPAAAAIARIQEALNSQGLGLKIFDAYRPWSVSLAFWQLLPNSLYVANPAHGSNHNRGTAIDLTLISLKTGAELSMGTGFDNFTDSAHHSFRALPDSILRNRRLLKTTMESFGFKALETEWWHYTYRMTPPPDILDIPFKKFDKRDSP